MTVVKLISWIKVNKLSSSLIALVLFFLFRNYLGPSFRGVYVNESAYRNTGSMMQKGILGTPSGISMGMYRDQGGYYPSRTDYAPTPEEKQRMVVQESSLSLLVKDVAQTLYQIKIKTTQVGGYMVQSNLTRPDEGASGDISLRIPGDALDDALKYFKTLSIKVVSENLRGDDVTDQYKDNDARLNILSRNKARFEEIMVKAQTIDEILRVQQEIFNLQAQIDGIKGQQNYLSKTSQMAKINIFLATDELALPYAPAQPWRPEAVLKLAVRSLLTHLQSLGSLVIWVLVYSVVWVPALAIFIFLKKRFYK